MQQQTLMVLMLCEISVQCGMSWRPPWSQAHHEDCDKTSHGRRITNKAICFSKKAKETMLNPRKLTAGHFVKKKKLENREISCFVGL